VHKNEERYGVRYGEKYENWRKRTGRETWNQYGREGRRRRAKKEMGNWLEWLKIMFVLVFENRRFFCMEFISNNEFIESPLSPFPFSYCFAHLATSLPRSRSARRAQGGSSCAHIRRRRTARGRNAVAGGRVQCFKVLALAGVVGGVGAPDGFDGGGHAVGLGC
jgi:hypothetical protein